MAKLIKMQIDLLKEKLLKLKQEKENLIESKVGVVTRIEENSTGDINYQTNEEILRIAREIKDIETILNESKEITSVSYSKVDIGTTFIATIDFNGDIETDTYMLVEKRVTHVIDDDVNIISSESPFGKAVIGKEENDLFHYETDNDIIIKGTIDTIGKKRIEEKQKVKK